MLDFNKYNTSIFNGRGRSLDSSEKTSSDCQRKAQFIHTACRMEKRRV